MGKKKFFRVMVAMPLGSASGRKILTGVHRFLGKGYDWDVELIRRETDFAEWISDASRAAEFDGILVAYAETPDMRRQHRASDTPTVFVDYPDPIRLRLKRRAFVHDDEKAIAAAAAQHLLAAGRYRSFCYVPPRREKHWSEKRRTAFAERLAKVGHPVLVFGGGASRSELSRWLKALDKPAAILAAFDDRASDVLEACRRANLSVPNEVAVLGIDNDELICEATVPPLSSIPINFEEQGYRAARELHALMLGSRNPKHDIRVGVLETVVRKSTPGGNTAAALADRARVFIQNNALKGISSRNVIDHLRVSRRLAEMRFREVFGCSILDQIVGIRIEKVKELLRTTDLHADEIASRCGYRNAGVLQVLFKRATGLSLRAWKAREATRG